MKKTLLAVLMVTSFAANANVNLWQKINAVPASVQQAVHPNEYLLFSLQTPQLENILNNLTVSTILQMPAPDGTMRSFKITESPCMELGLATKYPGIKTFTGIALDNKAITAKLDITYTGFHAMVFDGSHTYIIDPYSNPATGYYICYYKKEISRSANETFCGVKDVEEPVQAHEEIRLGVGIMPEIGLKVSGTNRYNYRLAMACTGEYSKAVAGTATPTKALSLSAIVTSVNRVNGVYEREIGVHMNLIANNEDIIYLDGTTDPYNNSSGGTMMGENQSNLNTVIGTLNYDIGHVLSTGGGGIAQLGSVCSFSQKAQGVTGQPNPVGASFDIDFIAHEMGHQFGGTHTFNANTNSCLGNGASSSAYEPGSGSTIMAYAGICGNANNIQAHSDAYFHAKSLSQIADFLLVDGFVCANAVLSNNMPPSVPAFTQSYNIPYLTPFELIAPVATDTDNDTLTYCWEEWDLGGFGQSFAAATSAGPIFRSFSPSFSRDRVFTNLGKLRTNFTNYLGEKLPEVDRTLSFKLTVRDILNGYGTFNFPDDKITLNVTANAGPFKVNAPNTTTDYWQAASTATVTWDVANTTSAPVNCSNVDIYLSTDDGISYPYTLITNTPNDGTETITVPSNIYSAACRIKVKATGNVFFDISNQGFSIFPWASNINAIAKQDGIDIYPVPAKDILHIDFKGNDNYTAIITNTVGQQVWNEKIATTSKINVAAWASGVYYLQLLNTVTNEMITKKFIVE